MAKVASLEGARLQLSRLLAASLVGLALAGCALQEERRGHLMVESDIQQVQPGMSQEQVRGLLGTPDTTSTTAPATYYYISSTVKGAALFEPSEVDRHILAVYFTPFGTVDQVGNYTLKDGRVVDVISRTTPTARGDKSLIEKLFKGIGKKQQLFDPSKPQ